MKPWEETWRVGRKVGRTLYRELEGTEGELIGVLDTRELARFASVAPNMYRKLLLVADLAERAANEEISHTDVVNALLDMQADIEGVLLLARGES